MPAPDYRVTLRRRWLAITAATVVLQFSFWLFVVAGASGMSDVDAPAAGAGALALALALAPLAFLTLAFGSRHPRAPGAVLRAMGLFLVFGVPFGLLDPVFGAAIGFAAGGAATLRPLEDGPTTKARALAVVALLPYLAVLLAFAPQFGLLSGAVLPFAVHGLVDQAIEDRRASR